MYLEEEVMKMKQKKRQLVEQKLVKHFPGSHNASAAFPQAKGYQHKTPTC